MRQLRLTITGLVAAAAAIGVLTGCAAPAYTYAADSADKVYFKVPSSWHQISPNVVSATRYTVLGPFGLGPSGGPVAWSRAYSADASTSVGDLMTNSILPTVYASVQTLKPAVRDQLSFNLMRNIFFPVTPDLRKADTAAGLRLPGFALVQSSLITNRDGVHGINELFQYDLGGGIPDVFDQTVLTNVSATKLYVLVVQCYAVCFATHANQITAIVQSFTVRGS
jgi:hypothetical protein